MLEKQPTKLDSANRLVMDLLELLEGKSDEVSWLGVSESAYREAIDPNQETCFVAPKLEASRAAVALSEAVKQLQKVRIAQQIALTENPELLEAEQGWVFYKGELKRKEDVSAIIQ